LVYCNSVIYRYYLPRSTLLHFTISILVSGQNRAHKTAAIVTASTKQHRSKPCKAQNRADHNRAYHSHTDHIAEIHSSQEWFLLLIKNNVMLDNKRMQKA